MLYIIVLVFFSIWMVLLIRKSRLSWHSIVAAYAIGVYGADAAEVTFNLLLGLYKFPTHLLTNPIFDNELGIIFSDTLILPFAFIIYLHYAKKEHPWRTTLLFTALFIALECIFLMFGYLEYIHWNLAFSALFYVFAFRLAAHFSARIIHYDPPISYSFRLLSFSHTVIMWVGALFASPILMMYQFRPGVFQDIMADCRFTDLLSGDVLSLLCAVLIPRIHNRLKVPVFAVIAIIGAAFAMYSYYNGWLIYHNWNHLFTLLRYAAPVLLIMLYDRWESNYRPGGIKNESGILSK